MVDRRSGAGLGLLGVVATLGVGYLAIASDRGWAPFGSPAGAASAPPSLGAGASSINHKSFRLTDGTSIVFNGRNAPTKVSSGPPVGISYDASRHILAGTQWTDIDATSLDSCLSSRPVSVEFDVSTMPVDNWACYSIGDQNAVAYVQIHDLSQVLHQNGSVGIEVWIVARSTSG
jgi:hypothetical protein